MRIGIDARLFSESGVGRYIRNLLENLAEIDKKNEYVVFLLKKDFEKAKLGKNFTKVEADFRWYTLKEQLKLPKLFSKYNLDLVHIPHFNVPIFYKGKFVVTIHDLIHQHFAMRRASTHDPVIYKLKQLGYKKIFKTALSKSKKIITVSDFVKDELISEWDVNSRKIVITREAAEGNLIKLCKKISQKDINKTLEKFNIRPPFIFYIGNAHPHKNVEGLIESFLKVRQNYQYLTLVLAGHDHYFWKKIKEKYTNKNIIFAGFISDEEMIALYKSAQAFVFPSFEEGFGIPLLEAFACGCPVVSSNAGSLTEVGDDAALYFNPKNIDDMSEKIMEVLNNQKLRKELIEKGDKRYKEFSWEKLARETLKVYEESV